MVNIAVPLPRFGDRRIIAPVQRTGRLFGHAAALRQRCLRHSARVQQQEIAARDAELQRGAAAPFRVSRRGEHLPGFPGCLRGVGQAQRAPGLQKIAAQLFHNGIGDHLRAGNGLDARILHGKRVHERRRQRAQRPEQRQADEQFDQRCAAAALQNGRAVHCAGTAKRWKV